MNYQIKEFIKTWVANIVTIIILILISPLLLVLILIVSIATLIKKTGGK